MKKRLLSFTLLSSILVFNSPNVLAYSSNTNSTPDNIITTNFYSEAFPDAYIQSSYISLSENHISYNNGKFTTKSREAKSLNLVDDLNKNESLLKEAKFAEENNSQLTGFVEATAHVEELLDSNGNVIDSRLMSKEDISQSLKQKSLDKINLSARTSFPAYSRNNDGKLKITLAVHEMTKGKKYQLAGTAVWSAATNTSVGARDKASRGDDFMALTWGGSYDFMNYGIKIASNRNWGSVVNSGKLAKSSPNSALVWRFKEMVASSSGGLDYAKQITVATQIYKSKYSGKTTSACLQYTHTYENKSGNVTITGGSGPAGTAGINITNVSKQWDLAAVVSGIPY